MVERRKKKTEHQQTHTPLFPYVHPAENVTVVYIQKGKKGDIEGFCQSSISRHQTISSDKSGGGKVGVSVKKKGNEGQPDLWIYLDEGAVTE